MIAGDGPATNEELRSLLNVRYHHRPVSIYGGMIFTFENEKVTEVFLGAAAE